MAKSKKKSAVESAAAAAAAAAVRATQEHQDVQLNWANDDEEDDAGEVSDEIQDAIAKIDEEAGGEIVYWELYCDSPIDKQGQIRKLSTSETKGVRDECLQLGPGEYHVIARHRKGTFIKGSRVRIKISGFAKPPAAAASTAVTPAMDPMLLMQRWDERQERRRLEAKAERNQEIRFWAPILAPIGTALVTGLLGRGGGENIKDLVAALASMKALSGGGDSSVDALLKGIELARDLAPDGKGATWPDVLVSGIRDVTKELRPLAEAVVNRRNGSPTPTAPGTTQLQFAPAQPSAPGPAAGNNGSAPPQLPPAGAAGAEGDPMWAMVLPLFKRLAGELEEYASNGADPGLAAEALLAKIPRLVRNQVQPSQVKEWLSQPDWWKVAVEFHSGLANYQGFCDDVRLCLIDIMEQELNPKPENEPEE
jgi:hypothetical protein